MAKGIGLIGNFRGKVGNMVGYNLKDSNNKQTQGVRVYQPVVKNPKSYGQAEQRAKLMPINVVYRMLKPIIDRGQESKAYGNKSRLAWLKAALKNYDGMWSDKNDMRPYIPLLPVTQGSLNNPITISSVGGGLAISVQGLEAAQQPVIGTVATAILAQYTTLQAGDQITVIAFGSVDGAPVVKYDSFELDTESTDTMNAGWAAFSNQLAFDTSNFEPYASCVIISREGSAGQHLRSTSQIEKTAEYPTQSQWTSSKESAIRSYMTDGTSADWPQEPIED